MSEPRNIYIARHGHREDFVGDRWGDIWHRTALRPHDPALSESGITQAKELGRRLQGLNIRHLFASPFLRTVETAYYVTQTLGLPIKVEEGICEWLNPQWYSRAPDFLPQEEIAARFPAVDVTYRSRMHRHYPEPSETEDAWPTIRAAVHRLLNDFEGDLLFIGHGASVAGIASALGDPEASSSSKMCSLSQFVQADGKWDMLLKGCTNHLSITEETLRFH